MHGSCPYAAELPGVQDEGAVIVSNIRKCGSCCAHHCVLVIASVAPLSPETGCPCTPSVLGCRDGLNIIKTLLQCNITIFQRVNLVSALTFGATVCSRRDSRRSLHPSESHAIGRETPFKYCNATCIAQGSHRGPCCSARSRGIGSSYRKASRWALAPHAQQLPNKQQHTLCLTRWHRCLALHGCSLVGLLLLLLLLSVVCCAHCCFPQDRRNGRPC